MKHGKNCGVWRPWAAYLPFLVVNSQPPELNHLPIMNEDISLRVGDDEMQEATTRIFSPFWFRTSGLTLAITGISLLLLLQIPTEQTRFAGQILGWWILVWAVLPPIVHAIKKQWDWRYGLPLQLCDITAFFTGWALVSENQLVHEIALYWGMTGALHALLTPQFTQGTQFFFLIEFYVSHTGLILGPMFLTYARGMELRPWSWLEAGGWLFICGIVVGLMNWRHQCNYMFLCRPPTAKNPFIIGQWPWYLMGFAVVMFLHFLVFYLIFR